MIKTTETTLAQIGIQNVPMIYVFNKADQTNVEFPTMEGDDRLVISAKDGASLDLLIEAIKHHLFADYETVELLIPFADGHIVSYLNEHATILNTEYVSAGTHLQVELAPKDLPRVEKYII